MSFACFQQRGKNISSRRTTQWWIDLSDGDCAINCFISDQSKQATNSLTKLINLASRGQLPSFVAPVFCSATLTALKRKENWHCTYCWVEVIWRFVAKFIAKEAAVELFGARQLGVAVRGGAESIVHVTGITFKKWDTNAGILQIDFRNAIKSVKRSPFLGSTEVFMTSIMCFVFRDLVIFINCWLSVRSVSRSTFVFTGHLDSYWRKLKHIMKPLTALLVSWWRIFCRYRNQSL